MGMYSEYYYCLRNVVSVGASINFSITITRSSSNYIHNHSGLYSTYIQLLDTQSRQHGLPSTWPTQPCRAGQEQTLSPAARNESCEPNIERQMGISLGFRV